ncbi:hypothetical protein F8M41_008743 [Gigaspora margarita]|uniref:Uncharacterized protein n=1 Tax=Gigaspora margarita TaxID=4874 RepID=A0A8H3X3V8_GIGMA|nr:hypothetical protein F8M41_008743 [Gigaspora margarita]
MGANIPLPYALPSLKFGPMYIEFGGTILYQLIHKVKHPLILKKQFGVNMQEINPFFISDKGESKSRSSLIVIGGDGTKIPNINDRESQQKWLETLNNCDNLTIGNLSIIQE